MADLKIGVMIFLVFLLSSVIASAKSKDIPPGVLQGDWIPLDNNCGIAIKEVEGHSKEAAKGELGTAIGLIYIKKDGRWYRFAEEPPEPKVQLLQK